MPAFSCSGSPSGEGLWMLLAMLAPISIAAGNVYRARFWPKDGGPLDLALAMSGPAPSGSREDGS